jgi:hypothetical protein
MLIFDGGNNAILGKMYPKLPTFYQVFFFVSGSLKLKTAFQDILEHFYFFLCQN